MGASGKQTKLGVRAYYRSVGARAVSDTFAVANRQGLLVGGVVAILAAILEWQLTPDADLLSIGGSAALAVLLVIAVVFVGSLVASPVRLARDSAESRAVAERERDEVQRRLAGRSSREQLADLLDEFGREVELLRSEVPESANDGAQAALWEEVFNDFTVRVQTQLRRHAPEWLPFWKETPEALLTAPIKERGDGLLDLSSEQLAQISAGLRAGTPPPSSRPPTSASYSS